MLETESDQRCAECSGKIIDAGEELVCASCGVVGKKEVMDVLRAPPLQAIDFTGQALGGYLGSLVPTNEERHTTGISGARTSYHYLKLVSDYAGREDSTTYSCAKLIERTCDGLGLPGTVMREAVVIAKKVLKSQTAERVGTGAVSSYSIITACRIVGATSVGAREVIAAHRALGRRVSISALIQLSLDSPYRAPPRKPQDYLARIIGKLSSDSSTLGELKVAGIRDAAYFRMLRDEAWGALARVDDISIAGHNPCALAATAVYAAEAGLAKREGRKTILSQRDLARCVGVAEYTVREQYRKIFKPVLILRNSAKRRTQALPSSS